jgi:hypothetical protein
VIEIAYDNESPLTSVTHRCGCLIFQGRVPLRLLAHCARTMGPDVFLDADAARVLGAQAVLGDALSLDVLRHEANRPATALAA